jgi:hypothetical protein
VVDDEAVKLAVGVFHDSPDVGGLVLIDEGYVTVVPASTQAVVGEVEPDADAVADAEEPNDVYVTVGATGDPPPETVYSNVSRYWL